MSWLGGILAGQNSALGGDIGGAGQIAGFGTSLGEGDLGTASSFYNDILSGNQAKIAQLLAPQIGGIAKQAQQKTATNAQFGDRSGGTNASNQSTMDTARSSVNDLISNLTSGAASGLAGIGQSALSTGLSANAQQASESQQQLKNFQDSILGQGTADFAASGLNAAEGRLGF